MSRRVGPRRIHRWFPTLHRWLGISSLVFVILLSVTGLALNHSSGLALGQRYISSEWLLRWYGIEAPAATASYLAGEHTLTLIGERLYFDDRELVEGVTDLVGAVAIQAQIAVATADAILLLTPRGELVERVETAGLLPGALAAFGGTGTQLVYRSSGALYRSDPDVLTVVPWPAGVDAAIEWSQPSDVEPERLETLQQLYRGRGLTLERLLLDVHSGRAFSRLGPWLIDLVAVALIALSLFGMLLWLRRRQVRRARR